MLLTSIPSSATDFTEYKTACPAPKEDEEKKHAGGWLPGEKATKFDEFSCLSLTIAAPKEALDRVGVAGSEELPVMVYVHGGAFRVGSGHVSALHGE